MKLAIVDIFRCPECAKKLVCHPDSVDAWSHYPEEVSKWFTECGYSQITVLPFPTAVTGVAQQSTHL